MKRIMFILLIAIISTSVRAQFAKTKWSGSIKGDNPQKAVFKFTKDTVVLYTAGDEVIETMAYTVKNNVLSLKKVSGQSDCDGTSVGQYKFTIKDGSLTLTVASDVCGDRLEALDKTSWKKG